MAYTIKKNLSRLDFYKRRARGKYPKSRFGKDRRDFFLYKTYVPRIISAVRFTVSE